MSAAEQEMWFAVPVRQLTTALPKMTINRFMSFVGMAFLWTSAQIPVYLFGMSLP